MELFWLHRWIRNEKCLCMPLAGWRGICHKAVNLWLLQIENSAFQTPWLLRCSEVNVCEYRRIKYIWAVFTKFDDAQNNITIGLNYVRFSFTKFQLPVITCNMAVHVAAPHCLWRCSIKAFSCAFAPRFVPYLLWLDIDWNQLTVSSAAYSVLKTLPFPLLHDAFHWLGALQRLTSVLCRQPLIAGALLL